MCLPESRDHIGSRTILGSGSVEKYVTVCEESTKLGPGSWHVGGTVGVGVGAPLVSIGLDPCYWQLAFSFGAFLALALAPSFEGRGLTWVAQGRGPEWSCRSWMGRLRPGRLCVAGRCWHGFYARVPALACSRV